MNEQTPKHFVLQLGAIISLYLSVSFLLVLLFGLINILLPDAADSYWEFEQSASNVRLGIAMLVVFAPTYLFLTRALNKVRRKDANARYLGVTKWLLYLSLLIGAGAVLIDLVVVIMTYLEGDATTRFFLKAGAVLLVVGGAFYYYLLDAKGYWLKNEKKSLIYGAVALTIAVASVIAGALHIETPSVVREAKIDANQINDLNQIQWAIESYIANNGSAPESLEEIDQNLPSAPTERTQYEYSKTEKGFTLCATFVTESQPDQYPREVSMVDKEALIPNAYNWEHDAKYTCFERIVNLPKEIQ